MRARTLILLKRIRMNHNVCLRTQRYASCAYVFTSLFFSRILSKVIEARSQVSATSAHAEIWYEVTLMRAK